MWFGKSLVTWHFAADPWAVRDVTIHPPETLRGQLQRGRGQAALIAAGTPGAGDLVYACVRGDPRGEPRVESRGLYYARLLVDLELPTGPVAALLDAPAGHPAGFDAAERRTGLAIEVLTDLVRLSRRTAAEPLRRYAWDGENWYAALDALIGLDDPDLAAGLDTVAVSRCDDADLIALVRPNSALVRAWAARHPRIAAALRYRRASRRPRARRAPAGRRPNLIGRRSDADLAELARRLGASPRAMSPDPVPVGDQRLAAIIELGRRRSPLLLDLAEELLPLRRTRHAGAVAHALRELGPAAVPRARVWADDRPCYAGVAIRILARHGTEGDIPTLLNAAQRAVDSGDWGAAAAPLEGLGRLRTRAALPLLRTAWTRTEYSYLRPRLLTALHAIAPAAAAPYAIEALWDCEEAARRHAADMAPLDAVTRLRLRRLRAEPAEEAAVRSAARRRLAGSGPGVRAEERS
jgi:hypothetical protein